MFVCLCKGITDAQIKRSVKNGAASLYEVRKELGVATQCCKCLPEARAIVNQALEPRQPSPSIFATPLFYPTEV